MYIITGTIDNKAGNDCLSLRKQYFVFLFCAVLTLFVPSQKSWASCTVYPCTDCVAADCTSTASAVEATQTAWTPIIETNIEHHINQEMIWIVHDFFHDFFVIGLAEMTEWLSAFGMYQVEIIGNLLDAKHQSETTRLFWQMAAEAHRDYHPSDDLCWYGTNSRSMVASEERGRFNALTLAEWGLARQLGTANVSAARNVDQDLEGRWRQFITTYCDPKENNWVAAGTGLDLACDHDALPGGPVGATDPNRINIDINYTRLVDEPRTIDINLTDTTVDPGDEDIIAMASHLYGTEVLSRNLSRVRLENEDAQNLYLALRSVAAKRAVAQNTFNTIVGMKSSGTSDTGGGPPVNTREFLAAALKDLLPATTSDADVYKLLGENPSYYAQLEILGKKIYQNPDFFANLYDGPANIARKSVAMKAIELMLDRALLESELRQEMVMSVLLSSRMRDEFRELNKEFSIKR